MATALKAFCFMASAERIRTLTVSVESLRKEGHAVNFRQQLQQGIVIFRDDLPFRYETPLTATKQICGIKQRPCAETAVFTTKQTRKEFILYCFSIVGFFFPYTTEMQGPSLFTDGFAAKADQLRSIFLSSFHSLLHSCR